VSLQSVETRTKAEVAYTVLRDAIREGRLAPGSRLVLREVADDLGMSFTPVREALQTLAAQGLVEQRPHVGTVVASFTPERAEEVYRLRAVLEPLAARLATERATDEDVARAETVLARLDDAVRHARSSAVPELNAAFHRALYAACGSPYLVEFVDRLWNGLPYQAISLASRAQDSHVEHRAILDAFRSRDAERCAALVTAHVASGAAAFLSRAGAPA